jgi:hypothetical protein
MFAAMANATSGSKGFHPVIITRINPSTMLKLVQLSCQCSLLPRVGFRNTPLVLEPWMLE